MWSALRRGQWSRSLHAFRSFATVSSQSGVPAGFEELRVLPTLRRYVRGKKAVKELRQQDIIPGVVMGGRQDPLLISIERRILQSCLAQGPVERTQYVLELDDGESWTVVKTHTLEMHPVSDQIMGVTFSRDYDK